MDALLVAHVIAGGFYDVTGGLFDFLFVGFQAVDHIGLEISHAFFAAFGSDVQEVNGLRVQGEERRVVAQIGEDVFGRGGGRWCVCHGCGFCF